MTRERGADRDLGGVAVTDFAYHDDVGVLPQHVTKGVGKREADFRPHLHLIDARHLVLDRILDRDNAEIGGVDLPEKRIERGGFTGAGGAGHEDDAVRIVEHAHDLRLLRRTHAEAVHRVGFLLLI